MSKKILITGVILILAMLFMGTCEAEFADEEPEYTDVEYSKDGSQVTVYLDGVGVPKTAAQRAMSKGLAEMTYDYFEVIFIAGANIVRTSWELGEQAGISGITRATGTGTDYSAITSACMFVGKGENKTLLGVGKITSAAGPVGTGGALWLIPTTRSVTFSLAAIRTGLTVTGESAGAGDPPASDVVFDSLDKTQFISSSRVDLGGTSYPRYIISSARNSVVNVGYQFDFVTNSVVTNAVVKSAIKHIRTTVDSVTTAPEVKKRTPRFMDGGRYKEPKNRIDTKSTVAIAAGYATSAANNASFQDTVPLVITTQGNGIFSFYIQIPVYMVNNDVVAGTPDAERWYIRTGLGPELYNLDDGIASGGCVFIATDDATSDDDWLSILWDWI